MWCLISLFPKTKLNAVIQGKNREYRVILRENIHVNVCNQKEGSSICFPVRVLLGIESSWHVIIIILKALTFLGELLYTELFFWNSCLMFTQAQARCASVPFFFPFRSENQGTGGGWWFVTCLESYTDSHWNPVGLQHPRLFSIASHCPPEKYLGSRMYSLPGTVLLSGSANHLLLNNLGFSGIIMIRGPSKKMAVLIFIPLISLSFTLIGLGVQDWGVGGSS